jgi:methyl-accepting chemotaxis protein
MKNSLKFKLMSVFGIIVILLVAGSSWFAYNKASNILQETLYNDATESVRQNSIIISQTLNGIKDNLLNVNTTSAEFEDMDSDFVRDIYYLNEGDALEHIVENNEYIEEIFISDINGNYILTTNEEGIIENDKYFNSVLSTKGLVISTPFLNERTGSQVITIFRPVMANETITIVLGMNVKLSQFQNLVTNMKIGGSGYGLILDDSLNVVAHPEDKYIGNNEIINDGDQTFNDLILSMSKGEKGIKDFIFNGKKEMAAYTHIDGTGWSLAIMADSEKLFAPLAVIRNGSLLIGFISIILGLLVIYIFANNITGPIIKLSHVTEEVSKGDLSQDLKSLKINSRDEIGALLSSLEKMINNLRNMIEQIMNVSEQVAASSEELAASGEQVGKSAEQVGGAIQNLASGAEEQSAQISETNNIVKNLINKVDETVEMSEDMSLKADEVNKNILTGNDIVKNSINQASNVKGEISVVAETINSLGETSKEIGNILELISGISQQTNLLALNAAIEAARAGESGRGFSVVADEIRSLAEESSMATEKIDKLIKEIQSGVSNAVEKMLGSEDIVNQMVEAIEETGDVFGQIEKVVQALIQIIEEISSRAQEMGSNSKEVERARSEVAAISQEAAGNSEEVAASSEEQSAATEEIISSANHLAELTESLAQEVSKFKL